MNSRRAQWIRFFEVALARATDPRDTHAAADVADAAMKCLGGRTFGETKVESLLSAAQNTHRLGEPMRGGFFVPDHLMAKLGKAIADLREDAEEDVHEDA